MSGMVAFVFSLLRDKFWKHFSIIPFSEFCISLLWSVSGVKIPNHRKWGRQVGVCFCVPPNPRPTFPLAAVEWGISALCCITSNSNTHRVCEDFFSAEFQRDAGVTLVLSYIHAMILGQHYPNVILPILNIFVFWERNGFILLSLVIALDNIIFSKEHTFSYLLKGKIKNRFILTWLTDTGIYWFVLKAWGLILNYLVFYLEFQLFETCNC